MDQTSDSSGRAIIVAVIGLIGTIVTTIGVVTSGVLGGGGGSDGGAVDDAAVANAGTPDSELVTYSIENAAGPSVQSEVDVFVDGQDLGTIFSHQSPNRITESISEGQHSYTLKARVFNLDSQYCESGQDIVGSGTISVQAGDTYEVLWVGECSSVELNEAN